LEKAVLKVLLNLNAQKIQIVEKMIQIKLQLVLIKNVNVKREEKEKIANKLKKDFVQLI